ncbi:MAG: RHS repeat-associated core domain-containing protein [Paucimonas sp.]|jgi:RHS repeat-associated protein|nr:RHS repeat-associated core domain-containing protein [Paucimonas sp.]
MNATRTTRRSPQSSLAFNGQMREHPQGWYHLGHGRRIYSPQLMRFHCADPLSPFDAGGLNAYAYCQGDPLNFTDPTGRAAEDLYGMSYLVSILTAASSVHSLVKTDGLGGLHAVVTGVGIVGSILGVVSTSFSIKDPQSAVVSTLMHVTQGISAAALGVGLLAKKFPKAPVSPGKLKFAQVLHGKKAVRKAQEESGSPPASPTPSRAAGGPTPEIEMQELRTTSINRRAPDSPVAGPSSQLSRPQVQQIIFKRGGYERLI